MQNFGSLAGLEVAEKCMGVEGHVATVSNLNPSYLELLPELESVKRQEF